MRRKNGIAPVDKLLRIARRASCETAARRPQHAASRREQSNAKAAVLSAQLIDVTIQDYAQTSFAGLIPESGIQVTGMFTNAVESVSAFIGLEKNVAGNRFKDLSIKTAQDARK